MYAHLKMVLLLCLGFFACGSRVSARELPGYSYLYLIDASPSPAMTLAQDRTQDQGSGQPPGAPPPPSQRTPNFSTPRTPGGQSPQQSPDLLQQTPRQSPDLYPQSPRQTPDLYPRQTPRQNPDMTPLTPQEIPTSTAPPNVSPGSIPPQQEGRISVPEDGLSLTGARPERIARQTVEYPYDRREDFQKSMRERLDSFTERIRLLRQEQKNQTPVVRDAVDRKIQEWEREKNIVDDKIGKVKSVQKEFWPAARSDIEDDMDTLEESLVELERGDVKSAPEEFQFQDEGGATGKSTE